MRIKPEEEVTALLRATDAPGETADGRGGAIP
jgi:hypothetical protein